MCLCTHFDRKRDKRNFKKHTDGVYSFPLSFPKLLNLHYKPKILNSSKIMQNYTAKKKKQPQKTPTKKPNSNCFLLLLREQNPKSGRANNCPSVIQGLHEGPEDAERHRLSWREHRAASCKTPEKWGWIRYGRDAEKSTTDRIMKNYAKIQNNEIAQLCAWQKRW